MLFKYKKSMWVCQLVKYNQETGAAEVNRTPDPVITN